MTTLQDWVGRRETSHDTLRQQPARFMQATLDITPDLTEGDALPPLWHWLYFLDAAPAHALGRDAHPKRGGFLPPVSLPRRMWAGGRLTFNAPLILGQDVNRTSTIKSVNEKQGRSGNLCFVTVEHQIFQGSQLALTEEHDIVYRDDPDPQTPTPMPRSAPTQAEFCETITPTEVMLFRYSALTFNGHRIHYDADYARKVEGYEGLVFHGPLTATLLAGLANAQSGRPMSRFEYRGMAPIAGPAPFEIQGQKGADATTVWAKRHDGALAMQATARF